jgi:hypothetical protein
MATIDFQFTDRDAEIVHYVYQLRVATLDHLAALTNRSHKTLERRLPKLRERQYLRRLKPRPHKGLYLIGPESVRVLISGGYAPQELAEKRLREKEWKDLSLPHLLLVASIHAKLLVLCERSQVELAHWQHDHPKLWDNVQTPDHGTLPIRPDAHFILRRSGQPGEKKQLHFFLEADVGTMSHSRIALKIKGYTAYHQQQRHVAKFGMNHFRVAVITQTKARAENLRAEFHPLMSAAQRRAYHFLPLDELTLDALLGDTQPREV